MCEMCDDDRVALVNLDQLARSNQPTSRDLMDEADKMAQDCDAKARHATTWCDRWFWWTAKRSALELAWHLSHIDGPPREQSSYTSLDDRTPWGMTLDECWQRWVRESRGETVPL